MKADDGGGSRAVVMIVDGDEVVVWEPPLGVRPDLAVIDRLTRMQLDARRRGYVLRLRNPCVDMLALVELVGLSELFGVDAAEPLGSVEVLGQPERGEQLGVQEVVEADDAAVGDLDDL